MPTFLRVSSAKLAANEATPPEAGYQEALVKLIPSEIIGLYLGGKNSIEGYFGGDTNPPDASAEPIYWAAWAALCLIALLIFRRWATSDASANVPPQWSAIVLTAISFGVWVYSFGDVFEHTLRIWHPVIATLLVLVWTFSVPLVYRMITDAKQT